MIGGGGKEMMARQLMNRVDLGELGLVKALAAGLAEMERAQADAFNTMAEAHGADVRVQIPDTEDRKALLLRGASAASDGNAAEWWIGERWGHALDADPAEVAEYAEMDPEDWNAQVERWAAFYRGEGFGGDRDDRDLAEMHVSETFGAPSLDWFEEKVVGLDRGDVLRQLLAGNLESIEYAMRDAAEEADTEGAE
jgi:hypothetical protein